MKENGAEDIAQSIIKTVIDTTKVKEKVMATLADLLQYKDSLDIEHPQTGKIVKTLWIRVLGDLDLGKAYKAARLASAAKREALRDPESEDYKDEVLGIVDLDDQEKKDIIKTGRLTNIIAEATVAVARPDLIQPEEVAIDPDAATLEELENLDKAERESEKEYRAKIDEYVKDKSDELDAILSELSPEELTKQAQAEVSTLVPFSLFITEVNAQKAFYGTFQDETCKKREFESVDDFKQLPTFVQEAIIIKMNSLEVDGPSIKN
jgi:hypothetical protein